MNIIEASFLLFLLLDITMHVSAQHLHDSINMYRDHWPNPETHQKEAQLECKNSKYRTIDGSCNNLEKPMLGASNTAFARLVQKNNYADGIHELPRAKNGGPLPNAREISLKLFPDKPRQDNKWNLNTMQWGQILTHDLSSLLLGTLSKNITATCCDNGQLSRRSTNSPCAPIYLPKKDPIRISEGTTCMATARTITTKDRGSDVKAEPISAVTSYMDASLVYGSDDKDAAAIRAWHGGRLKIVERNGHEWPPSNPNITCFDNATCYLGGDVRFNQNIQLTLLQIIMLREHNRLADTLAKLNPHWCDETLYQEARRIFIAIIQYINYYEFLPILLGKEHMIEKKLIYPQAKHYVNDYNPKIDPTVLVEHATAAFRHFHSLIKGYPRLYSEDRKYLGKIRMSDWYNKPSALLEKDDNFNDLLRGLTIQKQSKSDRYYTKEVTRYFFRGNKTNGVDLRAIDIHRSRDHGVSSYVDMRAACGLKVPKTFKDMLDFIPISSVLILKKLYKNPVDVDLVVGGSIERNVPGALIGPTFLCILTEQFYRTRVGDRYFFENSDPKIAFSLDQLNSIREGASIARLLCDNADGVKQMQPKAFELISRKNRLQPCEELPSVNLKLWKEDVQS